MFKGKVAVITGAAQGIGLCIAEEFRKQGATVCVIDKQENPGYVGDIADEATLRDFAAQEYGVIAPEVLHSWGIRSASDIGDLVYALIGVELLAASPGDKRSDFDIDYPPYPCGTEQAVQQPAFSLPKID